MLSVAFQSKKSSAIPFYIRVLWGKSASSVSLAESGKHHPQKSSGWIGMSSNPGHKFRIFSPNLDQCHLYWVSSLRRWRYSDQLVHPWGRLRRQEYQPCRLCWVLWYKWTSERRSTDIDHYMHDIPPNNFVRRPRTGFGLRFPFPLFFFCRHPHFSPKGGFGLLNTSNFIACKMISDATFCLSSPFWPLAKNLLRKKNNFNRMTKREVKPLTMPTNRRTSLARQPVRDARSFKEKAQLMKWKHTMHIFTLSVSLRSNCWCPILASSSYNYFTIQMRNVMESCINE